MVQTPSIAEVLPFGSFELLQDFIRRKHLYHFCSQTERMFPRELLAALLGEGMARQEVLSGSCPQPPPLRRAAEVVLWPRGLCSTVQRWPAPARVDCDADGHVLDVRWSAGQDHRTSPSHMSPAGLSSAGRRSDLITSGRISLGKRSQVSEQILVQEGSGFRKTLGISSAFTTAINLSCQ